MADVTNYTIENASGANVRTDLNNVFAAIQSSNSKSSDLASSQCVAGMPFLNTTTNILKIRNSSNGAFTEIGNIDSANLGLLLRSGGTMTGVLKIDDSNSASTPALSFDTDPDTGLFRKAANKIGLSAGGEEQMFFDADGITINLQNEITFSDAALGMAVEVPSIDGGKSKIKIPSGTQHGKQLRLKGKGMPILRRNVFGDLYIRIITEVPVSLSKRQKELLEEFKEIEDSKPNPIIKSFFEKAKRFWKGS